MKRCSLFSVSQLANVGHRQHTHTHTERLCVCVCVWAGRLLYELVFIRFVLITDGRSLIVAGPFIGPGFPLQAFYYGEATIASLISVSRSPPLLSRGGSSACCLHVSADCRRNPHFGPHKGQTDKTSPVCVCRIKCEHRSDGDPSFMQQSCSLR